MASPQRALQERGVHDVSLSWLLAVFLIGPGVCTIGCAQDGESAAAQIVFSHGPVAIGNAGDETSFSASDGEESVDLAGSSVPREATLRTYANGRSTLRLGETDVRVDSGSELQLLGPYDLRLRYGRLGVSKCGSEHALRILTPFGIVEKEAGAPCTLMTWVSAERLLVACLSGSARLSNPRRDWVRIEPDRLGIATAGCLVSSERAVDREALGAWTRRFEVAGPAQRALAADVWRPLASRESVAPPGVHVEELSLEVRLRGPLAAVRTRARLSIPDDGTEPVPPAPGDVVFPPPEFSHVAVERLPGSVSRWNAEITSVSVMEPVGERFCFALLPEAWSLAPVEEIFLSIRGSAVGGIEEVAGSLRDLRWERGPDAVSAVWRERNVSLRDPLLFVMKFRETTGADLIPLATAEKAGTGSTHTGTSRAGDTESLVAIWDVARVGDERAPRERVLVGLDASLDYGPGGLDHVCLLAESVIDQLLPDRFVGMFLFDGRDFSEFPYPSPRSMEGVARDVRAALWSVIPAAVRGEALLSLQDALAGERLAPSGSILMAVTGEDSRFAQEVRDLAEDQDLAGVLLVELDSAGRDDGERQARFTPGVDVFRLRREADPVAAAAALVGNLPWCGGQARDLVVRRGGEVLRSRPPRSTLRNEPVVALCRFPADADVAVVGPGVGSPRARHAQAWEIAFDPSQAFGPVELR